MYIVVNHSLLYGLLSRPLSVPKTLAWWYCLLYLCHQISHPFFLDNPGQTVSTTLKAPSLPFQIRSLSIPSSLFQTTYETLQPVYSKRPQTPILKPKLIIFLPHLKIFSSFGILDFIP